MIVQKPQAIIIAYEYQVTNFIATQQVVIMLGSKKTKNINVRKSGFLKLYGKAIW